MRALTELRDPVAVAFAAATALAAIWLDHDLIAITLATVAVLVCRVGAGLAVRRLRPPARPAQAVPVRGDHWYAPLTRREADVAVLIRDCTNKEIAERLVLSDRTIDNHVQNIMNRLDLHHRAQIAAWVAERNSPKGPIVADVESPLRRPRDPRGRGT